MATIPEPDFAMRNLDGKRAKKPRRRPKRRASRPAVRSDIAAYPDAASRLTPCLVIDAIATLAVVALPVARLADYFCVTQDDLTPHLISLTDSDQAHSWEWFDEERYEQVEVARRATAYAKGEEYEPLPTTPTLVVTMTPDEADRRRLRINASGRRWTAKYKEDPPDRLDWSPVQREVDMKCDPPGKLDKYPAKDDMVAILSRDRPINREERMRWDRAASSALQRADLDKHGLIWPTTVIVGVGPWPRPGQSRGDGRAKEEKFRPVDPRGPKGLRAGDDADRAAEERWKREEAAGLPKGGACACCGGGELGDGKMWGEQCGGGECCLVCGRVWWDRKEDGRNDKGVA